MFQDKILSCCKCGRKFVFTKKEQKLYAKNGFKYRPKRCRLCRIYYRMNNMQDQFAFTPWGIEKSQPLADRRQ